MSQTRLQTLLFVAALAFLSGSPGPAWPGPAPVAAAPWACAGLTSAPLPDRAEVLETTIEPADAIRPERCVVHGRIVSSPTSTIQFRVDLPQAGGWNGDLVFVGDGGFDGFISTDGAFWKRILAFLGDDAATLWKSVVVGCDSGHQGRGAAPLKDFSWAINNPSAVLNHADQANHLTLGVARALAQVFYGRAPEHRYMVGHSNGGRAGLIAAQRHPADYDGILAFSPAISQEAFAANLSPFFQHVFAHPDNWVSPAQAALWERAELTACDSLDGVQDGIISRPSACHYDPAPLVCKPGLAAGPGCLTPGQAESIRRVFSDKRVDVTLADGMVGYPAWGRGAETAEFNYIFGTSFVARDGTDYVFADNIIRYGIAGDPNASVMTHDPSRFQQAYLALSRQVDATDPDLSAFQARGGKLIVWYGASDYCVSYLRFAQYFSAMRQRTPAANTFARLYVSPGLTHGNKGPGANDFELLGVLRAWVARGQEPGSIHARKLGPDGRPLFSRPLCRYPDYPRFRGQGDANEATSFICTPDPDLPA